jgi:hypothetical protein
MTEDARPRDYWMCGHPAGCEEEPLWTPLTQQRPYCRTHDRSYERFSDIAKRPQARAANIGKRGAGAPPIRQSR